jgi:hypothetical protein
MKKANHAHIYTTYTFRESGRSLATHPIRIRSVDTYEFYLDKSWNLSKALTSLKVWEWANPWGEEEVAF